MVLSYIPVAEVGLETTAYEVDEDVVVVEVCAVVLSPSIPCPIDFPFDVALSTNNGSAGIQWNPVIRTP